VTPRNLAPNPEIQRTHIAVIEPAGRLYGSECCLLDIIDGVCSQKFSWTVFLPSGGGFDELLQQRDVECEFLIPAQLGQMPRLQKISVYAKILNRLWAIRPNLLYVNQTGSLRSAAVYASLLRLPMVCQVQTLEDAHWISQRQSLHKHVYAFVCNSLYIAERTNVHDSKKCVLYQGMPDQRALNAAAVQQSAQQITDPRFHIGILGRIADSKGHYVLLEAARLLREQGLEFTVVVIGEGLTPAHTQKYRTAVEQADLGDCFDFRGFRTDISHQLRDLDILVIPSLAEPLGRVLFDAAEHGVPVVISDSGGLGEVSRRFEIGVRVKAGSPEALAEGLLQVKQHLKQTADEFRVAAPGLFQRLPMQPYIRCVEQILQSASRRNALSVTWLGED
jgi:glycosyltransferase involved in cell wall biosynthesis